MNKKKITILLFAIVFSSFSVSANSIVEDEPASTGIDYSGVNIFGAGLSLGYYSYGYYGTRSVSVPPLNVYLEFGLHEYITAGPFGGYARWDYSRINNYNYNWSFYQFGARGSFHLTSILNEVFGNTIDAEKVDWYIAIMSGLEYRSSDLFNNRTRIFFGPAVGIRYYIGNSLALYLEGGRGSLGALTFGLSASF